jgi:hypothetical protein
MSTIITFNSTDSGSTIKDNLNTNFDALNTDKIETSVLDTDGTLAADSDSNIATQKATKTYVDSQTGNKYCVRVHHSTTSSLTSTPAALAFDTEDFDTDTMHDTVTNNSRITFTHAGKYHVSGNLITTTNQAGTIGVYILLNGSTIISVSECTNGNIQIGSAYYGSVVCSTIYSFSAGDYIELWGTASATNNRAAISSFSASLFA